MIYLDNASTTQIDEEVLDAMLPYMKSIYGNAGTIYSLGKLARKAVDDSRDVVAKFMGCSDSDQIIFTSGGTESNNMAIMSSMQYLSALGKKHLLVSPTEHDSVIKPFKKLEEQFGFNMNYIPVNDDGIIHPSGVSNSITENTGLVSVMYVNNETGLENYVSDIGEVCEQYDVLFHSDCVQAAGSKKIDVNKIKCDFASVSSHKIHGPKGVGCLYVKNRFLLNPMILGGSYQEFGMRGGTENVAGIVGFAKACEIAMKSQVEVEHYVSSLKQLFYEGIKKTLNSYGLQDIIHVNGNLIKPGKILNIRVDNVDSESLVMLLDSFGICISSGSACKSAENIPSHVLTAIGLTPTEARSSVRFSFSKLNSEEEIYDASVITGNCIKTLYDFSTNKGE